MYYASIIIKPMLIETQMMEKIWKKMPFMRNIAEAISLPEWLMIGKGRGEEMQDDVCMVLKYTICICK